MIEPNETATCIAEKLAFAFFFFFLFCLLIIRVLRNSQLVAPPREKERGRKKANESTGENEAIIGNVDREIMRVRKFASWWRQFLEEVWPAFLDVQRIIRQGRDVRPEIENKNRK